MICPARSLLTILAGLAVQLSAASAAPAQNTSAAEQEGLHYFETHVRPVLVEHCYKCHSKNADKLRASLLLDSKAGILKGGDSGKIIVPGKADESLLIRAIRYQVEDLEMPPKKKLPPRAIDQIVHWINLGAALPEDGTQLKAQGPAFDFDRFRREHWAFKLSLIHI